MMQEILPAKILLKRGAGRISEALYNPARELGSIRVLCYHNITDSRTSGDWEQMTTPRDLFDEQMSYLKEAGYRTVSAGEVPAILGSEGGLRAKTVCITFDDGYKDNLLNAMPVLARYGFKATVFLTTDFIGGAGYLGWGDIAEMARSGIFAFGCHSRSHVNLTSLKGKALDEEVGGAKKALEDGLGSEVETYAYPYGWQGSFDKYVINAVKAAGFKAAFTGIYGANTKRTDPYRLKRIRVSWLEDAGELVKILHGSYDWYSAYQRMVSLWHRP